MGIWWGDKNDFDGVDRTMNYTDEVCNLLGVKVGEPFKVMGNDQFLYRINKNCLSEYNPDGDNKNWYSSSMVLIQILEGLMEIDWTPEIGEEYFYPTCENIKSATWRDTAFDKMNKKMTGIYRDKKRAKKKQLKIWEIEQEGTV